MPRGGDWSGAPGHNCDVCGRRSENVGPRRGFDYANDVCGGCCDISSDDDGHNKEGYCRKCKQIIYMAGGKNCVPERSIHGYCGNCVKTCRICCEQIHPRHSDRYAVPLDKAIKDILDEDEPSIWLLGEDAENGETTYLCKKCHVTKWARHPAKGNPFPGFTEEEREELE